MWRSVRHINSKCLWWELSSVVTEDLSFISGLWNTKKWDFTWKLSWNHVQWKWVRVKQISDSKLFSVSWKPNVFLLFVRFSVRCLDVTNVSTGALDVSDRSGRGNATCRKHANDNCELSSSSFKCYLFIYLFIYDIWLLNMLMNPNPTWSKRSFVTNSGRNERNGRNTRILY